MRSGTPFSITRTDDIAGVGEGSNGQPVDLVGDIYANSNGKFSGGVVNGVATDQNFVFNPNAFASPKAGTFGNETRNLVRNPGDMARRIAAALCYVGLAHLDRLTIIPFGNDLGHESSPGRGKGRIFRVFEALEQLQASGPTDLRAACKAFASRPRQLGLVVIISDFLEPGSSIDAPADAETRAATPSKGEATGPQAGLKILRTIGHDVFAVHVTSEHDRDPGVFGTIRFVDVETGAMREIEVTPRLAAAYVKAAGQHAEALEHFCGRYDIGYVRADAERPFEDVILRTFRQGRFLA